MSDLDTQVLEDFLDKDNPKSVYNMVPESVQEGMEAITTDLLYMTPEEMEKQWPDDDPTIKSITSVVKKLRFAFWEEFHRAHNNNIGIQVSKIVQGVCSRSYWRDKVAPVPHRLAYVLKAPDNYKFSLMEIHELGLRQMKEILEAPNWTVDKFGNQIFDSKLAKVKQVIWEKAADRIWGGAVHRSLQVNENFTRELGSGQGAQAAVDQLPDFSKMDPKKLEDFVEKLTDSRKAYQAEEDAFGEERDAKAIGYEEKDV